MFIWFAENKAHYEKGQVFPFVIAIVVIIVIMAMVTANLGKLSIFKTDVSNGADAASLSSASGLSGFLMGLGIESDTLCGNATLRVLRMIEIFVLGRDDLHIPGFSLAELYDGVSQSSDSGGSDYTYFPTDLLGALMLYITYMIAFIFSYIKANWNGQMTWSSAKQTALSAAFNNSGVDERTAPGKKFKNYGGSYDAYMNQYMAIESNETHFAQFMRHPLSGFAQSVGEIRPGNTSPRLCISGFGWTQNDDETFSASFPGANDYMSYKNWVEVQVEGSSSYPIEPLMFAEMFPGQSAALIAIVGVGALLKYIENDMCDCWWCMIICIIEAAIDAAVFAGILLTMPVGYTFPGRDMERYTDDNPIKMQVTRHKDSNDIGMWNFQYGNVVAKSWGHAFVQDGSTIEPVGGLFNFNFDTTKHLFETEIVAGSVQ